jgi:hypothetical protein
VGELKPENVGQLEEEQVTELELEAIEEGILVTDPEVTSLVTQTLPEPSTAIPAGVKPREIRGQDEVMAQEVAPAGIFMRPFEGELLKVVATQTLLLWSTEIVPKEVGEMLGGAEKVEEGGALLPPVPPPPIPQEENERRKNRARKRRPTGPTLFFIWFPPD